jgi:hypothetical protein
MRLGQKVVTFKFMGVYWSLPVAKFEELGKLIDADQPFDLYELGARQLRGKPSVLDFEKIGHAGRREQ